VTHPEVTRFFMTIPEAVSLVLEAGLPREGNAELFILDMGEPVRIADLARNLIKLKGRVPDKDIKIEYTGLRPGEKLYEELLTEEEGIGKTGNDLIFTARPASADGVKVISGAEKLVNAAQKNAPDIAARVFRYLENNVSDIREAGA
jgi:FlaA1/EpsC-like NDP-sugar epimerase